MDRSPESIAVASRRAASAGHAAQISFAVDELDHFLDTHTNEAPFDAVIGRLVLMYQTDPVDTVRRLAKIVRMGGSVTFMENDAHVP